VRIDFVARGKDFSEILDELLLLAHIFIAIAGGYAPLRDGEILVYFFLSELFPPFAHLAADPEAVLALGVGRGWDELAMNAVGAEDAARSRVVLSGGASGSDPTIEFSVHSQPPFSL
jgi:hypothetical protein